MNNLTKAAALGVSLLLLSGASFANEENATSHEMKRHIVGVTMGVAHSEEESDYAVGLEYEYLLTKKWGIGAAYERAPDAHDGDAVSAYYGSAYFHPDAHWRLGLGVGEARVHGSHGYTEMLTRASVAYDFHVGDYGIAPAVSLDRVDGETIENFGVTISRRF